MKAVGDGVAARTNSFFYKGILIGLHVGTVAEHGVVGLVLVDSPQLALQEPGCRIEPLQVAKDLGQQHFLRMTEGQMRLFVRENEGAGLFIVVS